MHIDCETCSVRGAACPDCVISVLLQPTPGVANHFDLDESERNAVPSSRPRVCFRCCSSSRPRQRRTSMCQIGTAKPHNANSPRTFGMALPHTATIP
jgi:hypothetical protein